MLAAGSDHDDFARLLCWGNPIELSLVASLNRPGGNATGVARLNDELVPKQLGSKPGTQSGGERIVLNPETASLELHWREQRCRQRCAILVTARSVGLRLV